MANITINGTEYYNAPKNAGTTVRMWCKQVETDLSYDTMHNESYYSLQGFGLPLIYHDNIRHTNRFIPTSGENTKWCIKRDPISRFISCYTDKILYQKAIDWSVDQCIDMLTSGEMLELANTAGPNQLTAAHFLPQYEFLGKSTAYYDYIFDIREMDVVKKFCEDFVYRTPLSSFHARNLSKSNTAKVTLDPSQTTRLRVCYAMDYEIGWA